MADKNTKSFFSLVGGVVPYQIAFLVLLLLFQKDASIQEASEAIIYFAVVQLVAPIITLQLQNEMMRTKQGDIFQSDYDAIVLLALGFSLLIGVLWFMVTREFLSSCNIAIGSFIFAFSDVERARLLVSKGRVNPNKPHMFFVIGFSGAALVFVLMSNVAISVLALNLIVLLLFFSTSPRFSLPSFSHLKSLMKRGKGFILYRTPTAALDSLATRNIILLLGPLGEAFVNTLFLLIRLISGPVQILVWAGSLTIYKWALETQRELLGQKVEQMWFRIMQVTIVLNWMGLFIFLIFEDLIVRWLNIPPAMPITEMIFYMAIFVSSQFYIGWIGKIFDSLSMQKLAVSYELTSKVIMLVIVFFVARYLDAIWFLYIYSICYIMFSAGLIYLFLQTQNHPSRNALFYYLVGTIATGVLGFFLTFV